MKDLYPENYKIAMKEVEDDTNKWKYNLCSWIKKINIVKVSILPKLIYGITIISLEIPVAFFTEVEKNNPNIYTEPQKTPKSQSDPKKEQQSWRHYTS